MMSCGGSLSSCARGAGGSVACLDRKQRRNAPKTKTLVTRARVDAVDFGGSGKGGHGAGVIETQTFLRWRGSGGRPNRRHLLCGAPKGFAWQRFVAIDDTIGAEHRPVLRVGGGGRRGKETRGSVVVGEAGALTSEPFAVADREIGGLELVAQLQ
jgi:hypothetical protein